MSMNDPIADMLTRIRNANGALHRVLEIPASKLKKQVLELLKNNGFIRGVEEHGEGAQKSLRVFLKYGPNRERVIVGLKRVSKCGRRVYVDSENIPAVQGGLGVAVVSTSKGIMSDHDARREHVGGEVLCYVW